MEYNKKVVYTHEIELTDFEMYTIRCGLNLVIEENEVGCSLYNEAINMLKQLEESK